MIWPWARHWTVFSESPSYWPDSQLLNPFQQATSSTLYFTRRPYLIYIHRCQLATFITRFSNLSDPGGQLYFPGGTDDKSSHSGPWGTMLMCWLPNKSLSLMLVCTTCMYTSNLLIVTTHPSQMTSYFGQHLDTIWKFCPKGNLFSHWRVCKARLQHC